MQRLSFHIKRGDTAPSLTFALAPASVVLTGATVRFQMQRKGGATVIDAAATVVTATGTPTVRYDWHAGDTATAGDYEAEFLVIHAGGARETFPAAGFIAVTVHPDVPDME